MPIDRDSVRKAYRGVVDEIGRRLKDRGYRKRGTAMWRIAPDCRAFAGVVFRSRIWRESKRIAFYISIQGGHVEYHRLNADHAAKPFSPSEDCAQYGTDISNPHGAGEASHEWVLFPSTQAETVVESAWSRIETDALALVQELLDDKGIDSALASHRVGLLPAKFRWDVSTLPRLE